MLNRQCPGHADPQGLSTTGRQEQWLCEPLWFKAGGEQGWLCALKLLRGLSKAASWLKAQKRSVTGLWLGQATVPQQVVSLRNSLLWFPSMYKVCWEFFKELTGNGPEAISSFLPWMIRWISFKFLWFYLTSKVVRPEKECSGWCQRAPPLMQVLLAYHGLHKPGLRDIHTNLAIQLIQIMKMTPQLIKI